MWKQGSGIMGVGYEGMNSDAFVQGLADWRVNTLVDVRLHPLSRKKGFSKRSLTEILSTAGIGYVHLPALGNPKDNREGFARPGTTEADVAHARYRGLLEADAAQEAIERIATLARNERVAVLCFEASERGCHRQFVLEEVKSRLTDLAVA
ncbi:uncharacterized protein (DUF488 family) [Arthrobacter ulcerisalmonis]|nr:DUF488 domain-containing protein [Arthrobacter ulcerisalmonis]MDQ0663378.1 uncharacterized protein (DUF488 family) [Arthrobacter ulcerisalmonis]